MERPRTMSAALAAICLTVTAGPALSQERTERADEAQAEDARYEHAAMMEAWQNAGTPGDEHQRLARMAGTWDLEIRMWMDPAGEPTIQRGTSVSRMTMDGRYLTEQVESELMGAPFQGLGTTGYNNVTGEYESSWVDNHSTAIYMYRGWMNEAGNEMVMEGSFQDPVSGQPKETRGILKFLSSEEMRYESYEKDADGTEQKVMEITYRKRS